MKYLGNQNDRTIMTIDEFDRRVGNRIKESIKAHRRKTRENVFPNLEEIAFAVGGSYYKFVSGEIVKSKSYAQPFKTHRFYLTPGEYKIVLSIRRQTGNDKLKFNFSSNRTTSPQVRTVVISDTLSLNNKSYEYDLVVERMGTYDFTISFVPTTEVIAISELSLLRMYK